MGRSNPYPDEVFRFCPACGAEGFAVPGDFIPGADGKHRFACSVCGFRFYINSSVGVAAILLNPAGELLMTRRLKEPKLDTLDLPGGFADPGEPAEEALRREVLEEVHLEVTDLVPWRRSYCNEYEYGGITYFTNDFIYTATVRDWQQLRMSDPEEAEPLLLPLDEVDPGKVGLVSIRRVVTDLLRWGRFGPETA